MAENQPDATKSVTMFTAEQLADFVRAELAKERESHQKEMDSVKAQLDAMAASIAGTVPTLIREHGAGLGTAIHDTWSQFEQDMAHQHAEAERRGS